MAMSSNFSLTFKPAERPLGGIVSVPGDKSLAHRALLFGALADGISVIDDYPDSGVTRSMRGALESLGVKSTLENGRLTVFGNGWKPFPNKGATAYCGNSATTIRLLAGAVAGTGSAAVLDGSEGLRKRPMNRIALPLGKMGVKVETTDGNAPLEFEACESRLIAADETLPVASAQVKSCLVLAALGADGISTIHEPGPSRDHTERMLEAMGAEIESGRTADGLYKTVVKPLKGELMPVAGRLPGDISSATFLLVAAAIVPGSEITVRNVGINETRTGALDILRAMGAEITIANEHKEFGEPVGDVTLKAAPLHGVEISGDAVVRAIDEFPALAVAAAFADGVTTVHDAKELRYKETDRIAAIVTQLRALGAEAEEFDDGFRITGGTVKGGTAYANGDHRLAMSMALCGLRGNVTVEGAEILNESFPGFVETLRGLYGDR